ncbi:MAG: hypothetical protein IPK19_10475 [Chloroflexi bacterium]|nr:hypothetical protein [Chloroflexota bacterium]
MDADRRHNLGIQDLANNAEAIKTQPNGTGPFRLVENDTNRKVMEANADYWQGASSIQTLIWEFIQDPDTRLSALLAGQADAIDRVPPQHLDIISADPNFVVTSTTGIESVNLWIRPGRFPIWEESLAFRQAVMRSIDRDGLVAGLVRGQSAVATSFLPTNTLFHSAGEPAYTRDVEAATGDPFSAAYVYSSTFVWYFGDERLQELIDQTATTVEPAAREQLAAELQAYMWEQAWHVPLYNSDFTIAHSASLQGLDVRPNFYTQFYGASLSG